METGTGTATLLPYVIIYKCRMCDNEFEDEEEVLDHNNKHTGLHPYSCEDCKRAFQSKRRLDKHGNNCKVRQSRIGVSSLPQASNWTNSSNTQNPSTLPGVSNEVSSTLEWRKLEEKSDKTSVSADAQPLTSSTVIRVNQQDYEQIKVGIGDPTISFPKNIKDDGSKASEQLYVSSQHYSLQPDDGVGSGQSGGFSPNEAISSTTSSPPVSQKGQQLFGCNICVTMTGSSRAAIEAHKQHEHMDSTPLTEPINIGNSEPASVSRDSSEFQNESANLDSSFNSNSSDALFDPQSSANPIFPCPKCEKTFVARVGLVQHLNWHEGKKPFKCRECGRGFYSNSVLWGHLKNSQKNGVCSKASKREGPRFGGKFKIASGMVSARTKVYKKRGRKPKVTLELAVATMLRNSSGVNPEDGSTRDESANLDSSFNSNSSDALLDAQSSGWRFPCSKCEKTFAHRLGLTVHLNWHEGRKPFSCSECGRGFHSGSALWGHVKVSQKNGQCNVAGKRGRPLGVGGKRIVVVPTGTKKRGRPRKFELVEDSISMSSSSEGIAAGPQAGSTNKVVIPFDNLSAQGSELQAQFFKGVCPLCHQIIDDGVAMMDHIEFAHPISCNLDILEILVDKPETSTTMRDGASGTSLNRSSKNMGATKGFKCEYCGMILMYKQTYRYHVNKHTGYKPYMCKACGARFEDPLALGRHKKNTPSCSVQGDTLVEMDS